MDVHRQGADAAQGDDSPDRVGHAAAGDGSLVPEGWNRFLGSWNDEGIGAGLPIPGVSDSMVSHGQAMHPGEGLDDGHREGEDRAEESSASTTDKGSDCKVQTDLKSWLKKWLCSS